jgi:hypothetical protein
MPATLDIRVTRRAVRNLRAAEVLVALLGVDVSLIFCSPRNARGGGCRVSKSVMATTWERPPYGVLTAALNLGNVLERRGLH